MGAQLAYAASSADNRYEFVEKYDDSESINFDEIFRRITWFLAALWRGRWIFGSIVLAAVAAGAALTLLMTPQYFATASVQIDQETERVLGTEETLPASAYQDADRFLETNVQVLKSRATAIRVAQTMGLFSNDEFIDSMGATLRQTTGTDPEKARREAVLELLQKNLTIDLPVNSRVVSITFKSPDPVLSARVANTFADSFILGNLQRKFNSTSYARTFLEKQLAPARERLEESERQLVAYAREKGLIDTQGNNEDKQGKSSSVTMSSLLALNDAHAVATANRIAAEERWRVAANRSAVALPESYSNKAIQDLYTARAAQVAALRQEMERHKSDYPSVIQLKSQIAELDKQISSFNTGIQQSIVDQYTSARQQESALDAAVSELKRESLREQDQSIRYNVLRRDVDTNRSMYEALLQRFKEVSAASGIAANNISIVDRADQPLKPGSPKLLLNLALAFFAGVFLGVVVIIAREVFDDRIQTAQDAERKFGLAAIGIIPQLPADSEALGELAKPRSTLSEAYQSAASSVLLSACSPLQVLLLTSTQPAEGKSTSTIGLAGAFARLNKRTLLIECDMRRPSLNAKLGLVPSEGSAQIGLSDYLAHQVTSPAIETISRLKFDYMPAGHTPPSPVDLLGSPEFARMLGQLREKYDMIVIDSPPVLGLADAAILASLSDAVIFVVEAERSHRGRAKSTLARIRRFGKPVIGAMLTKMPVRNRFGLGYDYNYYTYAQ